jgi:hypothetical protein
MDHMFDRRDVLKIITSAAMISQLSAAELDTPVFLTKEEFGLLDLLSELIIPADEHSPGAHAARVAVYIDRSLKEAVLPEEGDGWRAGLAALNDLSFSLHHRRFDQASAEQQTELLHNISKNEQQPNTPAEHFFVRLKANVVFAYYSSSIGIHQETGYLGNVILEDYAGFEAQ